MRNCLVVDEMHPSIFPLLESTGIAYSNRPDINRQEILETIHEYEGIIVRSKTKLNKEFFERATRLRYVARAGSGKDYIDVAEAESRGIVVLNSPEGNRDAVAEHAIGLLLSLLNNITKSNSQVKNGVWEREANRGVELGYLTVGVIGYGHTGKAIAKRLVAFGCKVLVYDIKEILHVEDGIKPASLDEIQQESDVISMHIPLDQHNRHFVDKSFIQSLAKPIWLINTARGEVVNTHDLLEALHSGKILGAGLDVLENEKLATYTENEKMTFRQLSSLPQVIMTPHVAGWTHESYHKISEVLGGKIKAYYAL